LASKECDIRCRHEEKERKEGFGWEERGGLPSPPKEPICFRGGELEKSSLRGLRKLPPKRGVLERSGHISGKRKAGTARCKKERLVA